MEMKNKGFVDLAWVFIGLGLALIPLIATDSFDDLIPTGKLILNLNDSDVNSIPTSFSKTFTSKKFEEVYETAFGRFKLVLSTDEIIQELSKPGKIVTITQNITHSIWKITTQEYVLTITKTADKVVQECTMPDGKITKIKEKGEITEYFEGIGVDRVSEICSGAEEDLEEESEKIEEIRQEIEIPGVETSSTSGESATSNIVINEFLSNPETGNEWIELYNRGSNTTLTGWTIEDGTGSTYGSGATTSLNGLNITSYGYLVLEKGSEFSFSLNDGGDVIILKNSGTIVDKVAYGTFNDGDTSDNAGKPGKGESVGRESDGLDTNDDKLDFQIFTTPTKGSANS